MGRRPWEQGPGPLINHSRRLRWQFGFGTECQMPTQAAKLREKKSDPREAAAVRSETHLGRRGGQGAAAGRDGASSGAGAADT